MANLGKGKFQIINSSDEIALAKKENRGKVLINCNIYFEITLK